MQVQLRVHFRAKKNIQLDNDSITRAFNCLSFVAGFIRCIQFPHAWLSSHLRTFI